MNRGAKWSLQPASPTGCVLRHPDSPCAFFRFWEKGAPEAVYSLFENE